MAGNSDTQLTRSLTATVTQTQTIISPLPLASEIAGYEQILPGSADRILSMVEKESEHRRILEKKALELEGRDSLISMVTSGLLAVLVISCIVGLIIGGYTEGAGILAGSSIVSVIAVAFFKIKKSDDNQPPDSN